jgi:hypothetical protein
MNIKKSLKRFFGLVKSKRRTRYKRYNKKGVTLKRKNIRQRRVSMKGG